MLMKKIPTIQLITFTWNIELDYNQYTEIDFRSIEFELFLFILLDKIGADQ